MRFSRQTDPLVFYNSLWQCVLYSEHVRLPAANFALSQLDKSKSTEMQLHVIGGSDVEMTVKIPQYCIKKKSTSSDSSHLHGFHRFEYSDFTLSPRSRIDSLSPSPRHLFRLVHRQRSSHSTRRFRSHRSPSSRSLPKSSTLRLALFQRRRRQRRQSP